MKWTIILLALSANVLSINAQDKLIEHSFTMETWNDRKECFMDTTCYVYLNIKKGILQSVSIDLRTTTPGVKSIWLRLDGKNISQYPNLVKSLKSIRNKFRSWIKIAKDNNITDFSKSVTDDITAMPPVDVYFKIDDNKAFYTLSLSGGKPMVKLRPTFKVDENKQMCMLILGDGIYGFRDVPIHGYVPSLWSLIVTDATGANKEKFPLSHFYGLDFGSPEQMQSLIDALDFQEELQELQAVEQEKKQRKEEIDNLFK